MRLKDLQTVYFCSGARNSSLLKGLNQDNLTFEVDERSASFKALGAIKITQLPALICVTSGSAVAEVVPAMLEAYYSGLPLILLSGDRPKKLHGTGAPQTIKHEKITSGCCDKYYEVEAAFLDQFEFEVDGGPIHINVLVDDTKPHDLPTKYGCSLEDFEDFLRNHGPVVFLLSHDTFDLRSLCKKINSLGPLTYAESLSGAGDVGRIKDESDLLNLLKSKKIGGIVRVGQTPLSKAWRLNEELHIPTFSFDSRGLPALSFGYVYKSDVHTFENSSRFWNILSKNTTIDSSVFNEKTNFYDQYSECYWMKRIHDIIPEDSVIFLGNSLVIREFQSVQTKRFNIFGNRGVNGIDGQLSTAIGIAENVDCLVYCILGDMTTYYDLSAMRDIPENLVLFIINNGGGKIFENLNVDPRMVMHHSSNFEAISKGFGHQYSCNDLSHISGKKVIEIIPKFIVRNL